MNLVDANPLQVSSQLPSLHSLGLSESFVRPALLAQALLVRSPALQTPPLVVVVVVILLRPTSLVSDLSSPLRARLDAQ